MFALVNFDPAKVREVQQAPIVDYYLLLNNRVKMDAAQAKANKKK